MQPGGDRNRFPADFLIERICIFACSISGSLSNPRIRVVTAFFSTAGGHYRDIYAYGKKENNILGVADCAWSGVSAVPACMAVSV